MAVNVNLTGIDQLTLNFDGTTTAALTAPGEVTITHAGATSGITQLTGDVTAGPGSGSVAATLVNSSTARSHLGLGTMATQNATSVAVTGGTIDGTTVGATTPSSVAATSVTVSDSINVSNSGPATSNFKAPTSAIAALSCWRHASGDTIQTLGVQDESGVNWIASLNADGTIAGKSLKLTSSGGGSITFQDGTVQSTKAVSPTLQTNGTNNTVQTKLNLVAGSNVTLTADGSGDVTIASTGGGSSQPDVVYSSTTSSPLSSSVSPVSVSLGVGTYRFSVYANVGNVVGSGGQASIACNIGAPNTAWFGAYGATVLSFDTPPGTEASGDGSCVFYCTAGNFTYEFAFSVSGGTTSGQFYYTVVIEQLV